MISGKHLTPEEQAFLEKYSGTTPDPEAVERARAWTSQALATTRMPDVPHIEAIREALRGPKNKYEAIMVTGFIDNARVADPDTDEEMTVREWLESGRDPETVITLANSLKYGM